MIILKKEESKNVHSLFAPILTKRIGRQLKQRLHKEHINKNEDITSLSGKIANSKLFLVLF